MHKSLFFIFLILINFSFTQNDINSKTEPDFDRYIGVVKSIYGESQSRYAGFVFGFPKAGWEIDFDFDVDYDDNITDTNYRNDFFSLSSSYYYSYTDENGDNYSGEVYDTIVQENIYSDSTVYNYEDYSADIEFKKFLSEKRSKNRNFTKSNYISFGLDASYHNQSGIDYDINYYQDWDYEQTSNGLDLNNDGQIDWCCTYEWVLDDYDYQISQSYFESEKISAALTFGYGFKITYDLNKDSNIFLSMFSSLGELSNNFKIGLDCQLFNIIYRVYQDEHHDINTYSNDYYLNNNWHEMHDNIDYSELEVNGPSVKILFNYYY
tara:strand:- start:140 stop:1105 length:966 start_codon:yes stop_codon:yes gene_type:complete